MLSSICFRLTSGVGRVNSSIDKSKVVVFVEVGWYMYYYTILFIFIYNWNVAWLKKYKTNNCVGNCL